MNGSAPTSAAFRNPGSVTWRTTVTITRTKTAPTAPAGPAGLATSSAPTATASLRSGSVMWTTTAETTQTSPCRNAVSSVRGSGLRAAPCGGERVQSPGCSLVAGSLFALPGNAEEGPARPAA